MQRFARVFLVGFVVVCASVIVADAAEVEITVSTVSAPTGTGALYAVPAGTICTMAGVGVTRAGDRGEIITSAVFGLLCPAFRVGVQNPERTPAIYFTVPITSVAARP